MKQFITLLRSKRPLSRATTYLLGLLALLLAHSTAVRGQSTAPFVVRATPAGPLSLAAGQRVVLSAQAVYPAFVSNGFNGNVYATAVQSDGKILVGGDFTSYNSVPCYRIARLNLDGSLDASFTAGTELNGAVWAIKVQLNGSILVGGSFTRYGNTACLRLARLLPTGALDQTFTTTAGFTNGTVRAIGLLSTGDVVVGGDFSAYGTNTSSQYLVRLSSTGVLNTTFANATHTSLNIFNDRVLALVVQSGDNIVVGGGFVVFAPGGRRGIARLNSSGMLDTNFASSAGSGPVGGAINAIAEFGGKLLVGGNFLGYGQGTATYGYNCLALLTSAGELDTSNFAAGGFSATSSSVNAIAVQSATRIVVGGQFSAHTGISRNNLVGLTATGTLDPNFNVGTGFSTIVNSLAIQADSKTVVGGQFTTYNGADAKYVARLNNTGGIDDADTPISGATYTWSTGATNTASITVSPAANTTTTYSATATIGSLSATSATVSITVGAAPVTPIVVRVTPTNPTICTGSSQMLNAMAVYPAFSVGTGFNSNVLPLALQPDGKILAGGTFATYNGAPRNGIARLTTDGGLDGTLLTAGSGLSPGLETLAVQPNGKILVGGYFTTYNGTARSHIARLNADGSLDTTFDPGTGFDGTVFELALQPDGKVVVGGSFATYNNTARSRVARLNADGSLDTTFNPGTGTSIGYINTLVVQPDGKVVVGGGFTTYNGTPRNRIARLNTDGSLDTTFNPGTGFDGTVSSLALQPTGKVLVTGGFTFYNGSPRSRIAQLNANGSLDTTFDPGTGFSDTTDGLAVQLDGKVLVGGFFTSYNGTGRNRVARLNTDGSLDTTFNPGTGFDEYVASFAIQPDGKIVVGGAFSRFNGTSRNGIVRLNTNGSLDNTDTFATNASYYWSTSTGPISVPNIPTITVSPTTTTPYFVTAVLAGATATANVVVAVYPQPVAVPGASTTVCSGQPAQLGGSPAGANLGYRWSPATGLNNAFIANPTATLVNTTGGPITQTYTLTVTGMGNCNSTGTVAVTVNPLPTAVPGTAVAFCSGGSATLGAAAVSGNTYSWSPATGLSSATAANPTITLANSTGGAVMHTYTLTVTNATGCASTGMVAVTVNPKPVANAGANVAFCAGGSAQLGAAAVSGNTYSWSPATGLSAPTAAAPIVTLLSTGAPIRIRYKLTVTSSLACVDTSSVVVTVNPLPVINSIPLTEPLGATITINGTGLQGATSVVFAGVAGSTPVSASVVSVNPAGTQLTVVVPVGAGDGPLTVTTPCGITPSFGFFRVLRVLVVSTPNAPAVQAGTYNVIIVTGTGIGTLTGNVYATDSIAVLDGGILRLGPYQLEGPGYFRLASGGTLSMGFPGGLAPAGTTGAVDMTGSRRYSLDANYIYTGAANQTTGLGLPSRVRNLTDSTRVGAALTLSAPTSVAQVLTMASATDFNLNGQPLTLLSDATSTALVVNGPAGGKVVGQATMQRATTLGAAHNTRTGYRYYSPPVAGATVGSLASPGFQPVVNPAYNASNDPRSVLPAPTVLGYAEGRLSTQRQNLPAFDNGLFSPGALTDPLVAGAGYALTIPATATVSFMGTLTTGDLSPTLGRNAGATAPNAGWNLVGNPYPAPLNWDSVHVADRPNLDAALYTYESTGPNTGVYFSYVHGVGDTPIVPAGRSFFVRVSKTASPTGTLLFRNRQRVTRYVADTIVVASHRTVPRLVELRLAQNGIIYKDKGRRDSRPSTNVYEDPDADNYRTYRTTASVFNAQLDAYRIPSTTGLDLTISAPIREDELAIKALSPFTAGQLIPLTVRVPVADDYTIQATKLQQLPSGLTAFLDDSLLLTSTNLSVQPVYPFTVSAGQFAFTGGLIKRRFFLRFGPAVLLPTRTWAAASDVSVYPNPAHGYATVQIPGLVGATEVQATLLNQLGQVVRQQAAALPPTGTLLHLNLQNLATGVYALRLQANGATIVRRLVVD